MSSTRIKFSILGFIGSLVLVVVFNCNQLLSEPVIDPAYLLASKTSSPIHVVGRVTLEIPEEAQLEYQQRTKKLFDLTNKIDKPVLYTCNQDINNLHTYVWDEEWSSYDHLKKHLDSAHFNEWWNYTKQFLKGELDVKYALISDFHKV